MAVGVDLHAVSLNVAQDFIDKLRAHALRENKLFYRWAERRVEKSGRMRWRVGQAPINKRAASEEPPAA